MRPLQKLLVVLICLPSFCIAQDNSAGDIDAIAGNLIKNLRANSNEKIILQTNKRVYGTGEKIWFKAFIIDSLNNRLVSSDKVLYVDLVDDKDSIIASLFLSTDHFKTDGAIQISDSSLQGFYWLRAYTKKILQENVDNIGLQPVYILNGKTKIGSTISNANTPGTKIFLETYPEGGSLISGTNCVVGVKAQDERGNPVITSGIVKDNRDTLVARFTTNNFGIGKFIFSPTWFGKYKVLVQNQERYDSVAALPPVNRFSAQLSVVEQTNDFIKARVMLEDSIYRNDYPTYVLALSRDSLCFAAVGRGMYELNIPVSNFPGGMATLLLFNSKKELASERKIYVPDKAANVSIIADKQNYGRRENVKLEMAATDVTGKPVVAMLAVSVTDSRLEDTINNLYEDPYAGLSPADADLVMLTQKPEAQNWVKNGIKNIAVDYDNTDSITITGTIVNKKNEPLDKVAVTFMSNKDAVFFAQDSTDENGKFNLRLPAFNEGTALNVQVNTPKGGVKQEYNIILDKSAAPYFTTPSSLKEEFYFKDVRLVKTIESTHIDSAIFGSAKWLTPVTVKTKAAKTSGRISNVITRDMLQQGGYGTVAAAMLNVPGMHLQQGKLVLGGYTGFSSSISDEPIVVQDGVIIPTEGVGSIEGSPVLSYLESLSPNDIDYIKVLNGADAGIYGSRGGHGVIEIHTAGRIQTASSGVGMKTIYPKGFYAPESFNMPNYNDHDTKYSDNLDLRTTIYWKGDIITDNSGKVVVNFFTADVPATYVVTVTGITAKGEKIYKTSTVSRK